VGALLADELFGAEAALLDAEHRVEALLDRVFCGGDGAVIDPGFGVGYSGWNFDRGRRRIEVFAAVESREAIAALFGCGFACVVIHDHGSESFVRCACKPLTVQ
jgi:hypothetical protein